MNRIDVTRESLAATGSGTYLEIGVDTGVSFIPTRAKRKWGVDPSPKLSRRRRFKYAVFAALGLSGERIFPITSDEFFETQQGRLSRHGVDVALVDGLHTYGQVLRDVRNVLNYLRPNGVIVLHDCNPSNELMATPAESMEDMIQRVDNHDWTGAWTGDVWKSIVHARSLWSDVTAFVLDCDFGVGIITKSKPETSLSYTEDDIARMNYGDLAARRHELLDLRPAESFDGFLSEHTRR